MEKVILSNDKANYGDLKQFIVNERPNEDQIKPIFYQMCQIINKCLDNKILIVDLKLTKFVFVDINRTTIVLKDLDHVVTVNNENFDIINPGVGCFYYLSPESFIFNEIFSGIHNISWGLGVCLFTMLYGQYPFNGTTPIVLMKKIRSGTIVFPPFPKVTDEAKKLIINLCQIFPKKRLLPTKLMEVKWMRLNDLNKEDGMVPT